MTVAKKQIILILSGDLGEGHKQAANALLEASQITDSGAEVVVVDFLQLIYPHLHALGVRLYIQGLKKFPSVYGYLYTKTRKANMLSYLFKRLRLYGFSPVVKLLAEIQPTVIVCTLPIAAEAISQMKANGLTTLPAVTIITDHTDHSYWIHPFTDHYIVGSERVRLGLNRMLIPDNQISVTGIPVRMNFDQTYNRRVLCEKHEIDPDVPVIMVMGGGYGMMGSGLSELLTSDTLHKRMQFIIVCGHNAKLKEKLSEELLNSKHRVKLTGYINHVHEFMAISDLIITKPGGVSTSEAIALELPMLLYRPYPGQEQDNALFLLDSGVALQAEDDGDISLKLNDLFDSPAVLQRMKDRAKFIQTKRAAFQALDRILQTKTEFQMESRLSLNRSKFRWRSAFLKTIKRKNRMGVR